MKLGVGMYVRIKNKIGDCIIGKIENINVYRGPMMKYCIDTQSYDYIFVSEDMIDKASHNIIDLIEVGDVITFKEDKDVYRVLQIPSKEWEFEDFYLVKNYDGETEDIFVKYDYMKEYINSIVTKEQFESVQYKVGA